MSKKTFTGLNVQFPISDSILSGKKTIETRTYPIPPKYLNTEMLMIETPGKLGDFKSRIVALVKIVSCHAYATKEEFYEDSKLHLITPGSAWDWKDKKKFGWKIIVLKKFKTPIELKNIRKGIVYTQNITVEI